MSPCIVTFTNDGGLTDSATQTIPSLATASPLGRPILPIVRRLFPSALMCVMHPLSGPISTTSQLRSGNRTGPSGALRFWAKTISWCALVPWSGLRRLPLRQSKTLHRSESPIHRYIYTLSSPYAAPPYRYLTPGAAPGNGSGKERENVTHERVGIGIWFSGPRDRGICSCRAGARQSC
jgi:hypothetical protein